MKILNLQILFFILFPFFAFAQSSQNENELIKSMCYEFENTDTLSDSLRVENTYSKFLYPYLKKLPETKIDSIGRSIYFRFQRECETFRKFLDRVDPLDNWQELKEMPKSKLTKSERNKFEKNKQFYYLESDNQKTIVLIENGIWKDIFPDKTYSINKFKWISNDNEFELEFIESTNLNRKGYSRKGDKYFYKVIRKIDNYYEIVAQIPNQNQILLFKLFVK